MTTMCRKMKVIRVAAVTVSGALLCVGIGRFTAPIRRERVIEILQVPSYTDDGELPLIQEIPYADVPLSHSLQEYIYEVSADQQIPPSLIYAVIEQESNFNSELISDSYDYGLMQVNFVNNSKIAEKYKCADLLNPYQNIFCGAKILGNLMREYKQDYTKALMVYHMGENSATKAWASGITSTEYTEKVLELCEMYEEVLDE